MADTPGLPKKQSKLTPEEIEKQEEDEEVQEFKLLQDGIFNMLTQDGASRRNTAGTLRSLRKIQIKKRSEFNNEGTFDISKIQHMAQNFQDINRNSIIARRISGNSDMSAQGRPQMGHYGHGGYNRDLFIRG